MGRVFRTRYGSRPAGLQAENKEFKLDDKTFNDVHVVTLKRLIDQQSGRGPGTHRTDAGKFAPG